MDHHASLEMSAAYDFLLKFIIIGEAGTGKSCLLHHFIHNQFKDQSAHTIGVEFSSRLIKIGNKSVKLQLWDTAGQERFRSVTRSYYRGAAGALLVYDITKRSTFEPLSRWLQDARALASPDLVVVLVGNKTDRGEDEREVGYLEASKWANENGVLFLETSSMTGENVEAPFALAARSILLAIESGKLDPEKAGSGVSYGDRALRRVGSGSRFSFADIDPSNSLTTLPPQDDKFPGFESSPHLEPIPESAQLIKDAQDLFSAKPSPAIFSRSWAPTAIFADPICHAQGAKQYLAQWYGMPAAFSESQTLAWKLAKQEPREVQYVQKHRYKVKGLGMTKEMISSGYGKR